MIKDIMDEQKVEVFNTYTEQSVTRLWKFFTEEERASLEDNALGCYLLADVEEADVLILVYDEDKQMC